MIRVALVGLGNIAKKHYSAIIKNRDLKLVAICDNNKKKINDFIKNKKLNFYLSFDNLLDNEKIDYLILCTPSGLHPKQAIQASRKKINVISEKPMATSMKDAKKILSEIKKNKSKYFVVKQNRYIPSVLFLKKLLENNKLGKVFFVNINVFWNRPQSYYNLDKWRGTRKLDGGAILNQASHYVDLLGWLFGKIKKINCFKKTLSRKIEVEDTAVLSIEWKKGFLGNLNVSMLTYKKNYEGSLTLVAENGTISIGGKALNDIRYCNLKNKNAEKKLLNMKSINKIDKNYCYKIFYKNIVLDSKGKNLKNNYLSDEKDAQNTMSIIFNAYNSSDKGVIKNLK